MKASVTGGCGIKTITRENPEFVIYCGPMWGGKTSKLMSAIDRCLFQNKDVLVIKPKMDHRYSRDCITSHTGHTREAVAVSSGRELFERSKSYDVVAVDEAFMIDGVASALVKLYRSGKTILVATIQLSARGEVFPEVQEILPWATRVEVCSAVCSKCDKDAHFTFAKVEGLRSIEVGGHEKYEPRCHEHMTF